MQTVSQLNAVKSYTHPLKIIALGDSLIYGYGDPVGGGWVERLRRQWMNTAPGHVIYNLGVRGNTVAQVSARLEDEFRHRGELRNSVPDAIILSVGVNDSARLGKANGRNHTAIDQFEQQIDRLLERSQQLCPVLFVGIVPVNEAKMPFMDCFYYNHADQHRYKEITRLACKRRQIPYLDIFDLWLSRGTDWLQQQLGEDGLHPNVRGYEQLHRDVLAWQPIGQLEQLHALQTSK